MDHKTVLQLFDSEVLKMRNENYNIMSEYISNKNEIEEKVTELGSKNDVTMREIPVKTKEINKEIADLEAELSELETLLTKEASLLAAEQKAAEDQALEMKMMAEYKTQYKERLLKASAKPSKKDTDLLEKCKKKLEAYVKLTGVVWDFESCDSNTLSGYIRNANDTKLKIFNISINGKSKEEISEEMWKIIKKYTPVTP